MELIFLFCLRTNTTFNSNEVNGHWPMATNVDRTKLCQRLMAIEINSFDWFVVASAMQLTQSFRISASSMLNWFIQRPKRDCVVFTQFHSDVCTSMPCYVCVFVELNRFCVDVVDGKWVEEINNWFAALFPTSPYHSQFKHLIDEYIDSMPPPTSDSLDSQTATIVTNTK